MLRAGHPPSPALLPGLALRPPCPRAPSCLCHSLPESPTLSKAGAWGKAAPPHALPSPAPAQGHAGCEARSPPPSCALPSPLGLLWHSPEGQGLRNSSLLLTAWGPGSLSRRGQAGLPGVCFTRTLRPFPLVPPWGPHPHDLLTPKPTSCTALGVGSQLRSWGAQTWPGYRCPGGAPGTVSTPRTRWGIRETKPCSGGCGPAARSTCPRCSPSAGLRPSPPAGRRPVRHASPALRTSLSVAPAAPHGL